MQAMTRFGARPAYSQFAGARAAKGPQFGAAPSQSAEGKKTELSDKAAAAKGFYTDLRQALDGAAGKRDQQSLEQVVVDFVSLARLYVSTQNTDDPNLKLLGDVISDAFVSRLQNRNIGNAFTGREVSKALDNAGLTQKLPQEMTQAVFQRR